MAVVLAKKKKKEYWCEKFSFITENDCFGWLCIDYWTVSHIMQHHLNGVSAFVLMQQTSAFEYVHHHCMLQKQVEAIKATHSVSLTFVGEPYPRVDAPGCVSRAQQNKIQQHHCQIHSPYALCHPQWDTHSTLIYTAILEEDLAAADESTHSYGV